MLSCNRVDAVHIIVVDVVGGVGVGLLVLWLVGMGLLVCLLCVEVCLCLG